MKIDPARSAAIVAIIVLSLVGAGVIWVLVWLMKLVFGPTLPPYVTASLYLLALVLFLGILKVAKVSFVDSSTQYAVPESHSVENRPESHSVENRVVIQVDQEEQRKRIERESQRIARKQRLDTLLAMEEPDEAMYPPEHRLKLERDMRRYREAQSELDTFTEYRAVVERKRREAEIARREQDAKRQREEREREDELIRQAREIKTKARRERELAEAIQIVQAHGAGTLDFDKLGASPYPPDWDRIRTSVYTRDGYACQNCGASGAEITLHAHHIVPLSRGGTNKLSNLQTLCEACHKAVHSL